MNHYNFKIKLDKIKSLQTEIMKLLNEDIDPLFHIRKQIETKSYILKKCLNYRPHMICGLNLEDNRFLTLLSCFKDRTCFKDPNQKTHRIQKYNGWGDCEPYYIRELYKIWVKL